MTPAPVRAAALTAAAAAALPALLIAQAAGNTMASPARHLHDRAIVIDGHADTPQRLIDPRFDLGVRHPDGNVDLPRMREGGLDALFFSIWMPGTVTGPRAVTRALGQIDAVLGTPPEANGHRTARADRASRHLLLPAHRAPPPPGGGVNESGQGNA